MEVITVANNKGGVGKTMQCYQLACYLAHKGKKILVIDLDSQANLSTTFGVHIQRTLIPEWLIGDVTLDEIMVPSEGEGELHQNIMLVPASRHLANLSKLIILSESEIRKEAGRKERLLKMRLQKIDAERFDYVVIDTPPMLGDELIMALVASRRILIPTQAQDYSIDGLEELMDTFEIIRDTENPDLEFSIIPSMVNARRKIERVRLEELSQSFDITPPIRNLVQMQESISTGTPVCLHPVSSKGREDYEILWKSLGF
jgi:chromosome partitioning protein